MGHSGRVFWSFALLCGWLLSFPLHGPLLGPVAALHGGDGNTLGLVFTLFNGVGFAVVGLGLPPRWWRGAMRWGAAACLGSSALMYFSHRELQPVWVAVLGFATALFIIGWSRPFVAEATSGRVRFMAAVTLVGNVFLYACGLLAGRVPVGLVFLALNLTLLGSLWLSGRIAEPQDPPAARTGAPLSPRLLVLICLLILGLYVNGGLLYNLVYPAFQAFQAIDVYYQELPYLFVLALLWRFGRDDRLQATAYSGAVLLGLGFVAFGLFGTSLPGYFLTVTLILAAFAFLDVFTWTLLAKLSEFRPGFAIFGLGLAANVLALYAGGVLSGMIGQLGPVYPLLTGLIASGTVFLAMLVLPALPEPSYRALTEVPEGEAAATREENLPGELARRFPGARQLTEREWEVVRLMVSGATNEGIAGTLVISENTVKVHIRNINRKLEIANRNELLSALLRRG